MLKILTTLYITAQTLTNTTPFTYDSSGTDWPSPTNFCNGKHQSPIDLPSPPSHTCTRPITVNFLSAKVKTKIDEKHAMKTTGEFATLLLKNPKSGETLEYKSLQFHLHTPSEHTIEGKHFDVEVHLVMEVVSEDKSKTEHGLTVLGFLFDHGSEEENSFFKEWDISRNLEREFEMNLEALGEYVESGKIDEYFSYLGSLTTPGCNEIVNWFVFRDVLNISLEQKKLLLGYYQENSSFSGSNGNNRKVQELNGREVVMGSLSRCSFVAVFLRVFVGFVVLF